MNEMKKDFFNKLKTFVSELHTVLEDNNREWLVKGFIDLHKNIYLMTNDTKVLSKILEIQIFPHIKQFAYNNGYRVEFTEAQNHYPDMSFIKIDNESIKFAVDLKTTRITKYKNGKPFTCNAFTLGSHGTYFTNRKSTKNIKYPYNDYLGHFIIGIIYERDEHLTIDETKIYSLCKLKKIKSVIRNFIVFAQEKWRVASDRQGSGNTANIGSINNISKLIKGEGIFWEKAQELGWDEEQAEKLFNEYWSDYGKIEQKDKKGLPIIIKNRNGKEKIKMITDIEAYLQYRGYKK